MRSRAIKPLKIAPSILSADFSRLGAEVEEVTVLGADHNDIEVDGGISTSTVEKAVEAGAKSLSQDRPFSGKRIASRQWNPCAWQVRW